MRLLPVASWVILALAVLNAPAHAGRLFPPENADADDNCPANSVLKWENGGVVCGAGGYLGTATNATNPQRVGDVSTGLVSLEPSTVGVVTNGVEQLRVAQDGNVGIGTSDPLYKLHIETTVEDGIMIHTSSDTFHHDPSIHMYRSRGTGKSPSVTMSGDHLGEWWSAGYDGSQYRQGAVIMMMADGNSSAGTVPGRIEFRTTANGQGVSHERMRIAGSGNVGIGTKSPSYLLHVQGTVFASGAAGALSDERHKEKIQSLTFSGLETVAKLRPVSFVWKEPTDDGMNGEQFGFIAQEVEKALPQIVITQNNEERTKGLKYNELIPVLTKALQELNAKNDELTAIIERQGQEIEKLKAVE